MFLGSLSVSLYYRLVSRTGAQKFKYFSIQLMLPRICRWNAYLLRLIVLTLAKER